MTGGPYVLAGRPDAREGKDGVVASDVPLELDGRGRRCISMVHVMCSIKCNDRCFAIFFVKLPELSYYYYAAPRSLTYNYILPLCHQPIQN